MPPTAAHTTIKEKPKIDMAKAKSLPTPILAKKYMVAASLKPRPPIDIGNSVIALIIGRNIKK